MNIPIAEPQWFETKHEGFESPWRWTTGGYYLKWNKIDLQTLRLYYWDTEWRSDDLCAQGPTNILAYLLSTSQELEHSEEVLGNVLYLLGERSTVEAVHLSWLKD